MSQRDLIRANGAPGLLSDVRFSLVDVPSVPIEEPVLVFALAMGVFLIGPLAIRRLGLPGIVGILLLGVVLGPGGAGIVEHVDAIELLGTVGLVYLLFTVGLELDLRGLKSDPGAATVFGLASFGLTFVVGIAVGVYVLDLGMWAAVLLSAVFASHTLLSYPIVNQYGITNNDAVTAVFGGILFTDTLALIVLAIAVGAVDGGLTMVLLATIALSLAILFGAVWLTVKPVSRWFFRTFNEESYFEFLFVMVIIFAAAGLAELLELSPILGAFVAGLALNQLIPDGGPLRNRIEFIGNAFFIPFFLIHVGMLVDLSVLFDGVYTLFAAGVITGIMIVTKAASATAVGHLQSYSKNEVGTIFGLSIGQAAAALAITLVGYDVGLFGDAILNAVVLMLLLSAIISPIVTERYGNALALSKEIGGEDEQIEDPNVMLALSNYADLQRRLVELSFLFKADDTTKPVHLLSVVRPRDAGGTEDAVAAVQAELDSLRDVGNEAEIPIEAETRVSRNIASGIARGSLEVQADMILMGWDAERSIRDRIFGTIIDRVLDLTRLPVLIARLGHPVNTTERIYLVLPVGIDHHEGFFEAVHFAKKTADRLGAEICVVPVGITDHQFERLYDLVEPSVDGEFDSAPNWDALDEYLATRSGPDDLVVVVSPREGDVGWDAALKQLPTKLSELSPASFVMIHPRQGDPQYDRQYLRFD